MTSKKKLLLVEDDKFQQKFLTMMFSEAGYDVVSAATGEEGLDRAFEENPDLIVTDYNMPDFNGLEFCRLVREHDELKDRIIVMLTAHECTDDEIDMFHDLADGWVNKNDGPEEIIKQVNGWARLLD